jgi:hypothetical protein
VIVAKAAALLVCAAMVAATACRRSTLPYALGDREFWQLIDTYSEPPGVFRLSDNVVSNESRFADSIRWLRPAGGVYIGVGPEQNFSYIAALRPAMAFIIDIRRENLGLHMMYKALFELSADRAEFVSLLFSRPRPPGLDVNSSVDEIFRQYDAVPASLELFTRNAGLVRERLMATRGFPLTESDLDWIERTHRTFFTDGPAIDYYGSSRARAVRPSYRDLMTAKDATGESRSFLATEDAFAFVKAMQTRNVVVPVVGDFAGPKAIRGVGGYVRAHGARVHAFYGSNVGVYLSRPQAYAFCANLAMLPAGSIDWFIDSQGIRPFDVKVRSCTPKQN